MRFGLDEAYKARILAKRMFVNEHFLTLIYRPTAGAADKAAHSIFSMFDKASPAEAEDDSIDAFTDILPDAEKLMGREIGRGAWRERGCEDVKISVVAVS